VIAGLALGLVGVPAAGCGDDGGEAAPERTTTTAEPAVTTTTEPEDPWAVPEEIDEAYVQRVLEELYRLQGDLTREVIAEGAVTANAVSGFQTIYGASMAVVQINGLLEAGHSGFVGFRANPGNTRVEVADIINADRECIAVLVHLDFSEVAVDPVEMPFDFLLLSPSLEAPSGWRIDYAAGLETLDELAEIDSSCDA
jgi:ABC-type transporter Mla MlaB component